MIRVHAATISKGHHTRVRHFSCVCRPPSHIDDGGHLGEQNDDVAWSRYCRGKRSEKTRLAGTPRAARCLQGTQVLFILGRLRYGVLDCRLDAYRRGPDQFDHVVRVFAHDSACVGQRCGLLDSSAQRSLGVGASWHSGGPFHFPKAADQLRLLTDMDDVARNPAVKPRTQSVSNVKTAGTS